MQCVGRTTVRKILQEEGVSPSPKRRNRTWDRFVKTHAETLWQCDFFTKPVVTATGLRDAYVLAFLHVDSRRVICSPPTLHPDDAWCVEQAESMLQQAGEMELPVRYLVRDQDYKFTGRFDAVYERADVAVEADRAAGSLTKTHSSSGGSAPSRGSASTGSSRSGSGTSTTWSVLTWLIMLARGRTSGRRTSRWWVSGRMSTTRRARSRRWFAGSGSEAC